MLGVLKGHSIGTVTTGSAVSRKRHRFRGVAGIPATGRDTPSDHSPKLSTETTVHRNGRLTVDGEVVPLMCTHLCQKDVDSVYVDRTRLLRSPQSRDPH